MGVNKNFMGNKREIYFKVSDYVKSEVRKVYGQEVDKGVLIVENETWFGGNEDVIKKWCEEYCEYRKIISKDSRVPAKVINVKCGGHIYFALSEDSLRHSLFYLLTVDNRRALS